MVLGALLTDGVVGTAGEMCRSEYLLARGSLLPTDKRKVVIPSDRVVQMACTGIVSVPWL